MFKFKSLLAGLLLGAFFIGPVFAQSGQLPSGWISGNATANPAPERPTSVTAIFDRAFGSAPGNILLRGSSAWGEVGVSGDCTISNIGAIICSKTNGVAFGTMAVQNSNAVTITGGTITGLPTPVNASDAASKSYVDATSAGLTILPQTALATAAVLPNSPTYANGSSGVGATLTAGSNTTLTVDGTVATIGSVILVNNQASAFQNGIYTVTTAGSGSAAWVITRATYFNTSANMLKGAYTFILGGSTNANTAWVLAATTTTVGTTAVNFNQFSAASGVASIGGQTGTIAVGSGLSCATSTCATSAGVHTNVLNTQTSNYTIATSDCGKTIQTGTGSTGLFTVTLPSVSGFPSTCMVAVANGDTVRGKTLTAFPSALLPTLWPQQITIVGIVNGAWQVFLNPGKWRPTGAVQFNVATNGADDGECLGTGTQACASIQNTMAVVCQNVDPSAIPSNVFPGINIQVANGSYTQTIGSVCDPGPLPFVGSAQSGWLAITGNVGSPSSVVLNCGANACYSPVHSQAGWYLQGFQTTGTASPIVADSESFVYFGNMAFTNTGAGVFNISVAFGSQVEAEASWTTSGNKAGSISVGNMGRYISKTVTETTSGTPTYSQAYIAVSANGAAFITGVTYVGAANVPTGTCALTSTGGGIQSFALTALPCVVQGNNINSPGWAQ